MPNHDTPPQIRALQAEIHRRMGSAGRLALAMDMSRAMRELALGRIKKDNPGLPERDVMKIYFQEILARSTHRPA